MLVLLGLLTLLGPVKAQVAAPATGGAEFILRDPTSGLHTYLAYDLGSASMVLYNLGPGEQRVWYRDPEGRQLTQRLGESGFVNADENQAFNCNILLLTERIPAVASLGLSMLDESQYTVEYNSDGTRVLRATLIIGSLGFTLINHPSHAALPHYVREYTIDAQDRIIRTALVLSGETLEAVDAGGDGEYHEWFFSRDGSVEAEVSSWSSTSLAVIQNEDTVARRLTSVAVTNANAGAALIAEFHETEEGQEQLRESLERVASPSPWSWARLPAILTGTALFVVGAFAWWKRR